MIPVPGGKSRLIGGWRSPRKASYSRRVTWRSSAWTLDRSYPWGRTTRSGSSVKTRTPAEKEREVEQEARERMYQLFDEHLESTEETLPIRVETLTDQEGITRHYIFDGDELVVMTAGAMPWQADELAAQRQIAERIVTALSARPAAKGTTG